MNLLTRYRYRGRHRGQLAPWLHGPEAFAESERIGAAFLAELKAAERRDLARAHRALIESILPPAGMTEDRFVFDEVTIVERSPATARVKLELWIPKL